LIQPTAEFRDQRRQGAFNGYAAVAKARWPWLQANRDPRRQAGRGQGLRAPEQIPHIGNSLRSAAQRRIHPGQQRLQEFGAGSFIQAIRELEATARGSMADNWLVPPRDRRWFETAPHADPAAIGEPVRCRP
jgi:hypothetical protein